MLKRTFLILLLTTSQFCYAEVASWYGERHRGKKTANGERFDPNALTAAHKSYRFGTILKIVNLKNNKSVVVRINDRGPYKRGRDFDLSRRAAEILGFRKSGTARIQTIILN
jgi:rare lipoprotein A